MSDLAHEREMKPVGRKRLSTRAICGMILVLVAAAGNAQDEPTKAWDLLDGGLQQKSSSQRLMATRVLGLTYEDPHAAELAEKSLKDSNTSVREAAATALGQMHASEAVGELKQALNDKELPVVMAAAHALRLLNDPSCYNLYYEVLMGERKNDSGMIAQEMKVLHDPKQVAAMGFNEGIGYVPFAGMGWEAFQTIMGDRKHGTAAKAALISALAKDPDARTDNLLVKETQSPNWVLRVAALEAIAKRGNPALLPDVEKVLNDSRKEVKYTAAAVTVRLSDLVKARESGAKSEVTTAPPQEEIWSTMSGVKATASVN